MTDLPDEFVANPKMRHSLVSKVPRSAVTFMFAMATAFVGTMPFESGAFLIELRIFVVEPKPAATKNAEFQLQTWGVAPGLN